MTPNEYRKKHKTCATCSYYNHYQEVCEVKNKYIPFNKRIKTGKLCLVYKARRFEE